MKCIFLTNIFNITLIRWNCKPYVFEVIFLVRAVNSNGFVEPIRVILSQEQNQVGLKLPTLSINLELSIWVARLSQGQNRIRSSQA